MNGILSAISAELCSKGLRCLSFSCLCVGRANQITPRLNGTLANQFHSDNNIASDELLKIREEWLLLMLTIECFTSGAIETGHLQFVDDEAVVLNSVDNLAHLCVTVRLDHGECPLARLLKVFASVYISVVKNAKHARQNCDLSADEEIIELDAWDLLLLKELTVVLDVVHLHRLETGVVHDTVGADHISLLVIPLGFESVLLLAKSRSLLHHRNISLTSYYLKFNNFYFPRI